MAYSAARRESPATEAIVPRERPRPAILLVDDHAPNLMALEEVLAGVDARLIRASSGADALLRMLEQDVAMILLDVKMPVMDGFETAALIRQRERSRDVPIIFVTGLAHTDTDVQRAYSLGAVDFLFKPFDPGTLRAKVAVFLELNAKTELVKEQARQLAEAREKEYERTLAETRRRWEAERLQRHADELAEIDRRKNEFLAMLGHELRNPLAPIMTALQLMRLSGDRQFERERSVIERQADHMLRLVEDLLDVSRIVQGKVELRHELFELHEAATRAIEMACPLFERRCHELRVDVPREGLYIRGDLARLSQVIGNLLINAGKYTEPRGTIALSAAREGHEVVIRVRDTGIGITPETLARVFDLFSQGERSLARSEGGLGIGLTVVRSLVQLHKGSVTAHSEGQGRGSEFVVRLPLHVVDEAAVTPRPAETSFGDLSGSAEGARQRVLVVDDNEDAAYLLGVALTTLGYEVAVAHDGPEALRCAEAAPPDAAVLDIGLPVMDGYELAARLRALPGLSALPLVAITGYGQDTDRCSSREAGFAEHLVKPVDIRAVRALMAKLLGGDAAGAPA